MFEHDQDIVNSLLNENNDFKRLYQKHNDLKDSVKKANEKINNENQLSIEELKKEKLLLKDCMSMMIEDYKHNHI